MLPRSDMNILRVHHNAIIDPYVSLHDGFTFLYDAERLFLHGRASRYDGIAFLKHMRHHRKAQLFQVRFLQVLEQFATPKQDDAVGHRLLNLRSHEVPKTHLVHPEEDGRTIFSITIGANRRSTRTAVQQCQFTKRVACMCAASLLAVDVKADRAALDNVEEPTLLALLHDSRIWLVGDCLESMHHRVHVFWQDHVIEDEVGRHRLADAFAIFWRLGIAWRMKFFGRVQAVAPDIVQLYSFGHHAPLCSHQAQACAQQFVPDGPLLGWTTALLLGLLFVCNESLLCFQFLHLADTEHLLWRLQLLANLVAVQTIVIANTFLALSLAIAIVVVIVR
mmetsp:Transcript_23660/g.66821  ORF Transcript_23660/g.66821 Transcript_23660/m.66821 type:complete len:335 (-) Transcript_23660:1187-2191(-)